LRAFEGVETVLICGADTADNAGQPLLGAPAAPTLGPYRFTACVWCFSFLLFRFVPS